MRRWVLAVLLVASACKSSETKPAPQGTPAPQATTATTTTTASPIDAGPSVNHTLRFKIDDQHVEVGALSDDFAVLDLAALPPIAEWKTIIVRSEEGRDFTGTQPTLLTGIRTMRVVRLPTGAYEFRVMEDVPTEGDAAPSEPRIRHKMTNAKTIIIYTQGYTPPKASEAVSELRIVAGQKTVALDLAALEANPREPEPGEAETRDTWTLASVLKTAKLTAEGGLRLTAPGGKTLELSSEELADTSSLHIIKRNRRGQFNYRRWSLGPAPKRTSELRSIESIELR